jgi:hypothetical protein
LLGALALLARSLLSSVLALALGRDAGKSTTKLLSAGAPARFISIAA